MSWDHSLFLWQFAAACAGSVLFAGLIALLAELAARRWPLLRAHRSVWGMAQAAVTVMLLLAVLPGSRVSVLPSVNVPAAPELRPGSPLIAPPAALAPGPAGSIRQPAHDDDVADAKFPMPEPALHWLPGIWLCIYLAGLFWSIQDGERRDPALMLPDLESHASAKALARHQAQQTALREAEILPSARRSRAGGNLLQL